MEYTEQNLTKRYIDANLYLIGSYLTVTDFARFLGLSILFPRESAK